jgi:nitroreductase
MKQNYLRLTVRVRFKIWSWWLEMGIGSCWVTNFHNDEVKDILGAPQRMKLITVIPFGYPAEPSTNRKKIRKGLDEMVHYEKFGNHQVTE